MLTMNECEVCHGEKTITYQSMLGVIVTAPCPKCNKSVERDSTLAKIQANQVKRQPFIDWTVEKRHLQDLHDDLR